MPETRELAEFAVHAWTVLLRAGEYAQVDVSPYIPNVAVRVIDPQGRVHHDIDRVPGGRRGHEVRWIADAGGGWSLQVALKGASAAGYSIRLVARRVPTDAERTATLADSIAWQGARRGRQGDLVAADSLLRRALQLRSASRVIDSLALAGTVHDLAEVLYKRGMHPQGDSLASYALLLRQRRLGPDHVEVAASSLQLGTLRTARGQFASADSLYRQALAMRLRLLGEDHPDVAEALFNSGVLAYRMGNFAQAETLLVRAHGTFERSTSSEHMKSVRALAALGDIQQIRARFREAEESFGRALAMALSRLGPTHPEVATVLNGFGLALQRQQRPAPAESLYRRATRIRELNGSVEDADYARILNNTGSVVQAQGRLVEADSLLRRSLAIWERVHGRPHNDVAYGMNELGWNLYRQGRYREAEGLLRRSLAMWESTSGPNHYNISFTAQNLGILLGRQGRYAEAETLQRRALAIQERVQGPEHPVVAASLNDLGVLYWESRRLGEAEPTLRRALAIRERSFGAQSILVGQTLNNLALVAEAQSRYAEAEALFRESLRIDSLRSGVERDSYLRALGNLAGVYYQQRRFDEAEPILRRVLSLRERTTGPEHLDLSPVLFQLGSLLQSQRHYAEAESLFQRQLRIAEKAMGPGEVNTVGALRAIGLLYHDQGRYQEAVPLLRRSLTILEETHGRDSPLNARTMASLAQSSWLGTRAVEPAQSLLSRAIQLLDAAPPSDANPYTRIRAHYWRARIRKARGDRVGALGDLSEAIRTVEELRPLVGGDEETRAAFLGRFSELFDLMMAWRLEGGDVAGAVEATERGRARVLLDQLAAGRIDLRASIPSPLRDTLEARETRARARLAEYQQRITRLAARIDLTEREREEMGTSLVDSLRLADREFRTGYREILNASPLWRDLILTGGATVSLPTMQRRVVPPRGLLAMYQIGDERSFLFLVPPSGAPQVIPLRASAGLARTLGVTSGPLTVAMLERVMKTRLASLRRDRAATPDAARGAMAPGETAGSLEALAALRLLLVPNIAWQQIRAAEQVVVIPDRGLYHLPFEALVIHQGVTLHSTRFWLDDGPPIRYAASATTLLNLEQRPATRLVPTPDQRAILSLSAPDFAGSPPAGAVTAGQSGDTGVPLTRAGRFGFRSVLSPLPGTAEETRAIREAFGVAPSLGEVEVLQGEGATESRLRPALTSKRYIHLATHGLVDDERHALFAALALTPPSVQSATDDGFLQLHEIYQLRMPDAELAVLSACETNVGTALDGEGVFALSRGFLAAGARRVIASQWAVDDKSTAEMMGRLFGTIAAAEQAGRRVDYTTALRDAKRAIRRDARWADPWYWAPFVLTGAS